MWRKPISVAAIVPLLVASPPAAAITCKPARYQILGRVLDAGGAPLADASVRLVLDEVSAERFAKEGPRSLLTRTGSSGAYLALIDCEPGGGPSDAPSPCAAKPRHLTVSAEAPGHRGRIVVHKLKELEIVSDKGGCLVQVPDLKLAGE